MVIPATSHGRTGCCLIRRSEAANRLNLYACTIYARTGHVSRRWQKSGSKKSRFLTYAVVAFAAIYDDDEKQPPNQLNQNQITMRQPVLVQR